MSLCLPQIPSIKCVAWNNGRRFTVLLVGKISGFNPMSIFWVQKFIQYKHMIKYNCELS